MGKPKKTVNNKSNTSNINNNNKKNQQNPEKQQEKNKENSIFSFKFKEQEEKIFPRNTAPQIDKAAAIDRHKKPNSDWSQDQFDDQSGNESENSVNMIESDEEDNQNNNEWNVVTSTKRYSILIAYDDIPNNKLREKKAWIHQNLSNQPGYIGQKIPSYKHKDQFKVEFDKEEHHHSAMKALNEQNITSTLFVPNLPTPLSAVLPGIVVNDIPLGTTITEIKNAVSSIGNIRSITTNAKGGWQSAHINFDDKEENLDINNIWSIMIKKDSCRIIPRNKYQENKETRSKFCAKLTNLPTGCTAFELEPILQEINAKSCFIPRTRNKYNRMGIAFVAFESHTNKEEAINTKFILRNHKLIWTTTEYKTCTYCYQSNHLIADCKEKSKNHQQIRWKADQPIPNKTFIRPNQKKQLTNFNIHTEKNKTFAYIVQNQQNSKEKTENTTINNKPRKKTQNQQENNWDMLKEKLERLEHNLDNAVEMIKYLATKCNMNIDESKYKTKSSLPPIPKLSENNRTQEFNILNNRIDQTINQFAQLKELIKELSQILNKTNNNNNAMETDNLTDKNNANTQNWD